MAKGFGVSPITNTIYYGSQNEKTHTWTGKKEDVTNQVIGAVFEWFMGNMQGCSEYSISYPGIKYELVLREREESND